VEDQKVTGNINNRMKNKRLTLQQLINNYLGKSGAHILYMFNEYNQYINNALTYISEGLDSGEKIIVIEDQRFFTMIKNKLFIKGYTELLIQSITFIDSSDFYFYNNKFSALNSSDTLLNLLNPDMDDEIRTRIWGQVLVDSSDISELRRYESSCDEYMSGKNLISVCSYNALTTPSFVQNELLKVHEYLMVDDEIEKSPFYNEEYLLDFSNKERKRLRKLEKENDWLRKRNETLLIDKARQNEREKYLEIAKVTAEKENNAKSAFLSQMSHDLRTPLNTIQGYLQIILMSEDNKNLQKNIRKIFNASERLLKLIEEILDFTVIDSGRINIKKEKVQLKSFLENAVDSILEINNSDISIQLREIEENIYIEIDPLRFSQIITNLLNNAIKYNRPKGKIIIYCDYNEESEEIKINITDTGIGIEREEIDLIFEPFYRSKRNMDNWKGTGLGLAIVAQLTRRMNGKYGLITEKGNGSTFWVSFKSVKISQQFLYEEKDIKGEIKPLDNVTKVLYIEDNQDNIDVMISMLKLMGNIQLTCVTSGKSGIKQAFDLHPDIILLDLSLPDINGYELLNKFKTNPITKDIPIIAVSADALKSSIKHALLEGCFSYITKPINFEVLRQIMIKAIETEINRFTNLPSINSKIVKSKIDLQLD
jgi:signal transduction histidine kinase/AmiR/NasT family two-component response regulator